MAPILVPKPHNAAAMSTPSVQNPDVDTAMPDAVPSPNSRSDPPQESSKKRKRKEKETPHILHQSTFRKPRWAYLHLCLITPGTASHAPASSTHASSTTSAATTSDDNPALAQPAQPTSHLDPLTVSTLLSHPLTAYLGTTGAAIPIDILKTAGREVWVRIPRQDARGFRAGLGAWVGSCAGDDVPGLEGGGGGRVKVAWRVLGGSDVLGLLGGDGSELFGS